jgi:hypothetical protein
VYDPVTNVWTSLPIPSTILNPGQTSPATGGLQRFSDSNSEILANGSVMIMPVSPRLSATPVIYDPATNMWSNGPLLVRGVYQDEASWVKLPDQSILTIDPFGTNSERYIPSSNTWINDGIVPVSLYDPFGMELGAALLLPSGKTFNLGSTGHTALYTPSGTTAPGTWTAGPDIPNSQGTPDAPAAMMVNGKILCAVSPVPTSANHFPTPTKFVEYDPVANAFTSVNAPVGQSDNIPSYKGAMLDLPDGTVLYSHWGTDVYVYQSAGVAIPDGKPTVLTVSPNPDGSYHLTGLGLNGISEGAAYGDDLQMSSNYPLVRLSDASGNVYYARTYNWSSTGVMTGSQVVSTEYTLPANLPPGQYSLLVVANGFPSDPFCTTPGISQDPVAQTACSGESASFSVMASGSGPLAYQWRRGTAILMNGGNISGADTDTLVINPVGPLDAGTDYNCLVSNSCGTSTSAQVELVVSNCPPACYPNCDGSTIPPILNVNDFICFQAAFAAGDPYANCDSSSTPPVLNVNDFICFQAAFAAGCR